MYEHHIESTRKGLKQMCEEYKLPYLDPKNDIFEGKKLEELYVDGIHPNAKGYELMYKQIKKKLEEMKYI
ncbi:MAG: hypothetical protein ACLFPL_03185 [Candidatus Nanoarchaeia archaeon]